MLLTPPNVLLHSSPYTEIPKQPWNTTLASVNPANSEVTMIQPEKPEEPEAQVYVYKYEVWPYGLFLSGKISTKVRVYCVYNSSPWVIHPLTINDLATLWGGLCC